MFRETLQFNQGAFLVKTRLTIRALWHLAYLSIEAAFGDDRVVEGYKVIKQGFLAEETSKRCLMRYQSHLFGVNEPLTVRSQSPNTRRKCQSATQCSASRAQQPPHTKQQPPRRLSLIFDDFLKVADISCGPPAKHHISPIFSIIVHNTSLLNHVSVPRYAGFVVKSRY